MSMNNGQKNAFVKEQIVNTLLRMLKTQSLDNISVSDLVKEAGVGRVSFYRNYESKKDILIQEENRLYHLWKQKLEASSDEEKADFGRSLLNFYKEHSDFYLSIYRAGLFDIIMTTMIETVEIAESDPNPAAYLKSAIAYMISGYVSEWMKRGMIESGDELADSLEKIKANLLKIKDIQ